MAWEIETEHVDLAEMEHVTVFVERTVKTRSKEPARHLLQIRLGNDLTLDAEGKLVDRDGNVYDHRAKQQEILANLNELHRRARAFAARHKHEIYKGPAQ